MKQSDIVKGGTYRGKDGEERTVLEIGNARFYVKYSLKSSGAWTSTMLTTFARWAKERVDRDATVAV